MKILITGGCGFAGSHVIEHFLRNTDWKIVIFDKLTYAAHGLDRIRETGALDNKRVDIFSVDITIPLSVGILKECSDVDYIFHLAAESHVEKSIQDPGPFVYTNVVGTYHMLEFAKQCDRLIAFCQMSTDEVFGPAPEGIFYKEWDRYNCTNAYSATKAGAEQLVLAYMNCYKLPGFIVNCMNMFGEMQHSEKFIPLCIKKILAGEKIDIHGSPDRKKSGSRFYIHARNMAGVVHWLFTRFEQREKYNIVGEREITNLEIAQIIAKILSKELKYEIVNFHSNRPGHDLRYALDGSKLKNMGYEFKTTLEESLKKTVLWTLVHPRWLLEE